MPNPYHFLKAFGLTKGSKLGDATINKVRSGHDVIVRFRHYEFPITMELSKPVPNVAELIPKEHKVVPSQYGNDYDCFIVKITSVEGRTVKLLGRGIRIMKKRIKQNKE